MLAEYHSGLKGIVTQFFDIFRMDILPKSKWKCLNIVKLFIFPVFMIFGIFCSVWHLVFQFQDYSDLMDWAFTIIFIAGLYQSVLIHLTLVLINKKVIMDIFEYFDDILLNCKDELFNALREKHYIKSTKLAFTFARYCTQIKIYFSILKF